MYVCMYVINLLNRGKKFLKNAGRNYLQKNDVHRSGIQPKVIQLAGSKAGIQSQVHWTLMTLSH